MNDILQQLLEVQEYDERIIDYEKMLRDIPARKDDLRRDVTTAQVSLDAANQELKRNMAAVDELELEVNSFKEKLAKYHQQERDIKNNDEYRALQKEIFSLKQEIIKAEDRELELMGEVENCRKVVAEKNAELNEQQSIIEADIQELEERAASVESELKGLKESRAKLIADVDPKWLARYERLINSRRGLAIVNLEGDTCSGCQMRVPPQTVQNVRHGREMVACDFCGRFLHSE